MKTTAREEILSKVSIALCKSANDQPKKVSALLQVAAKQKDELILQLEQAVTKVGGNFYTAKTEEDFSRYLHELITAHKIRSAVAWKSSSMEVLNRVLVSEGVELVFDDPIVHERRIDPEYFQNLRSKAIAADMGITGVDYALADTGTLVLIAGKNRARSISLLPPIHVAIVRPEQVVACLEAVMHDLRSVDSSCITLVTGPSRTADIEQTLTVGVHGPKEIHLVLVA